MDGCGGVREAAARNNGSLLDFQDVSNKQIAAFFFTPCTNEYDEVIVGYYRCRCSTVRQPTPKSGYSNLMQHVTKQHPDFEATMRTAMPGESGTLASWVKQRSITLFGWMEWIIKSNLPLSFAKVKRDGTVYFSRCLVHLFKIYFWLTHSD